jgi:hypothetical protein
VPNKKKLQYFFIYKSIFIQNIFIIFKSREDFIPKPLDDPKISEYLKQVLL